jgi:hypothetical protein
MVFCFVSKKKDKSYENKVMFISFEDKIDIERKNEESFASKENGRFKIGKIKG